MSRPSSAGNQISTKERKIHFFRIDAGADSLGQPINVDLKLALQDINGKPFDIPSGRYQPIGRDGDLVTSWVDSDDSPIKLRFASIRRNALPQSELAGVLSPLTLAEEEGICEYSHFVCFEDGIVGVENNFYAPRPSRLPFYLQHASQGRVGRFVLEELLRGDALEQLKGKSGVRALELRVRTSYTEAVEENDKSLGAALKAAAAAGDAQTIAVILRPEPYRRVNLNPRILPMIKSLVGRSDLRENTLRFKATLIDEKSGRAGEVDLLEDKLVSTKKIVRASSRTRVVDSDDAYAKIIESYNELHDALVAAPSLSIQQAE